MTIKSICAGMGWRTAPALGPFISQVGADAVITFNGTDILTLKNIHEITLMADDFLFV